MEFSLFNLASHVDSNLSQADVLRQMKAMVTIADDGDFDIAWFAEHHFSSYCVMPSPLTTVAHMAGLTRNLRLGPAVVVMPFYEPVRLIEDIFYVDQLTEGRLVLGLGTGYQPREFDKFGFDIDARLDRGLEIWDALDAAARTGVIDFHGKHVDIDNAALAIGPLQKPIPTFAVGNHPEVRRRILERKATPLCGIGSNPPSFIGTLKGLLLETADELGIDHAAVPLAVQRYVFITDNKREALQAAEEVLHHNRLVMNMRGENPLMDGSFLQAPSFDNEPTAEQMLEYSLIGDADTVAEKIVNEAREFGVSHLSVFMQFAAMPYAATLKSLETFCARVIPEVNKSLEQK